MTQMKQSASPHTVVSKERSRSRDERLRGLVSVEAFDAVTRVDLMTFGERVFAELVRGEAFSPTWHLELLCSHLQAVAEGRVRREIINVPPRSLKSMCASVALVAWMLGRDPTRKIMVVSYGQELADKFGRDTRQVMRSSWYRRLFPQTVLSLDKSSAGELETTQGGGRLGVSFGGAVTGRGCDLLIIDDPIKPDEAINEKARQSVAEFMSNTLASRFNDSRTGATLVVMQRLHEDDLSGSLLRSERFEHLNLPAIAEADETFTFSTPFGTRTTTRKEGEPLDPNRLGLAVLDDLKANIGAYLFAAQYQQRPAPFGGGHIQLSRFGRYRVEETPRDFDRRVQSWDTANKAGELNDYSVCTLWGEKGDHYYLLSVDRVKMEYPKLKARIIALRDRDRPNAILIEDGASGQQLLQELKTANVSGVVARRPQKDKVMRLMEVSALIEGGFVMLPREAPWLDAYESEFAHFPNGRHDDQVDSTTQALLWLMETSRRPGVLHFLRNEVMGLKNPPEEAMVKIRSKNGCNQLFDPQGTFSVGNDGVFTVPESVARQCLFHCLIWERVLDG